MKSPVFCFNSKVTWSSEAVGRAHTLCEPNDMSQVIQVSDLSGSLPTPPQQLDDTSSPSSTGSQESQDSVFSHASSESSVSTLSSSSNEQEYRRLPANTLSDLQALDKNRFTTTTSNSLVQPAAVITQALPQNQRQHPRRSSSGSNEPRRVPNLVRQDERKVLFVNDLVGKSGQVRPF